MAEWSALIFSTDAFTRMCDLDSIEASAGEDNVGEEQCPDTPTVTRTCSRNNIAIEDMLCLERIVNIVVLLQCH